MATYRHQSSLCIFCPSLWTDLVFQHFFIAVQQRKAGSQVPEGHELRVAKRHKHYPSLFIREAKVEDNDDLLPIFQNCSQNLDKQYGMYVCTWSVFDPLECQLEWSQTTHTYTLVYKLV